MVKIDIKMPERCCECPCFDKVAYGRCNVLRKFLDCDEGSKLAEKRPEWCPLKEEKIVLCKDCAYFDWNWCTHLETYSKGSEWYCADGKRKENDK